MKKLIFILALIISSSTFAQNEVSFTLEDRWPSYIRLEAEQRALRNEMNARFKSIENRFETKFESIEARFTFLYWALTILIGLLVINLGYTVWDRRTAIYPIYR